MPDVLLWLFHKLPTYWDFRPSQGLIEQRQSIQRVTAVWRKRPCGCQEVRTGRQVGDNGKKRVTQTNTGFNRGVWNNIRNTQRVHLNSQPVRSPPDIWIVFTFGRILSPLWIETSTLVRSQWRRKNSSRISLRSRNVPLLFESDDGLSADLGLLVGVSIELFH